MIYLDYAANTPVDERVLDSFVDATRKYIANPNSSHEVGVLAKDAIDDVSKMLANYFDCDKEGIIYLSKEIYYSNNRVEEFIDQVILCDFEGSDSLVIGKNSEGDFMFYLGTDIGS